MESKTLVNGVIKLSPSSLGNSGSHAVKRLSPCIVPGAQIIGIEPLTIFEMSKEQLSRLALSNPLNLTPETNNRKISQAVRTFFKADNS